jgi:uncharacterized Zn finger protein
MELFVQIKLKCPKCKKEFAMNIKKFVPTGSLSCFGCGTVTPFNMEKAGRIQDGVREMERQIEDIQENFY